jgi:DNA-3-methyladenine glycosylase
VTDPPVPALDGPVEQVAPTLLGGLLRHGPVAVRLTEVEAYGGASDPASHAFRGRTARTEVMFGPPGRLYVYFSYGMHWAMNVVCGPDGTASGVLLRAGEVVEGVDVARSRRGRASDRDLARGPGRLAQALGVAAEHKGTSLLGGGPLTLELDPRPAGAISTGPRVGVSLEAERPWRFWLTGSRFVSDYKRSPRAPAR